MIVSNLVRVAATLVVLAAGSAAHAQAVRPYNQTFSTNIQPGTEKLLRRLVTEGRSMKIDGTSVFNGSDRFLPGKIALGLSDVIATVPDGDPRLAQLLADFRALAKLTLDDPNDTWGIYYYVSALDKLNEKGRLKAAVDPSALAKLRVRLDWRTFVDVDDYSLIGHPNNYYGVAFGIARLRHKLGWDGAEGADRLYRKLAEHYVKYSGPHGFADETTGEGRFDRYSILLAGEIAHRFIETGGTPPPELLGWLRKSADVMMLRLNPRGEGFEYGRSLGPYAETAIIEVLTAAAALDVLDAREKAMAYAYISRAAERYAKFWIDPATGSVNLWDDGRRTDDYRGKFRILGENLSLTHQYAYTNALWNRIGYKDKPPMPDFEAALKTLPRRTVTWFVKGEYDRMLLTLRDGGRVIGLPVINGGVSQHMHSPYYPVPFSREMFGDVADGKEPLLVPRFELADGASLMPLAFFRDVEVRQDARRTTVSWRQTEIDRLGGRSPVADDRIAVRTTYVFEPGVITRTDTYTPKSPIEVKRVDLAFGAYSKHPRTSALTTRFGEGLVREFTASGFDACRSRETSGDPLYRTSTGPMHSAVACTLEPFVLKAPLTLTWRLTYDTGPRTPRR